MNKNLAAKLIEDLRKYEADGKYVIPYKDDKITVKLTVGEINVLAETAASLAERLGNMAYEGRFDGFEFTSPSEEGADRWLSSLNEFRDTFIDDEINRFMEKALDFVDCDFADYSDDLRSATRRLEKMFLIIEAYDGCGKAVTETEGDICYDLADGFFKTLLCLKKEEESDESVVGYAVEIWYDPEDKIYVASSPELPGCMAHGYTRAEAVNEIETAMSLWLESAKDEGLPIPSLAERSQQ